MAGSTSPRARLAAVAGLAASIAACNPILGPTKPDNNWRTHSSDRFTFYVRPESFAEQNVEHLAEVLEDQYSVSTAALGVSYGGRVAVFLYDSATDAGLDSNRSGTAYAATEAVKVVCTPPLDDSLLVLAAHEVNHVIARNGLGRPGTSFLNEGIASAILSERFHRLGRSFLHPWTRSNSRRIPALADLANDEAWSRHAQDVAYNASASFLAYLLDSFGAERLARLFTVPSSGFQERFREIYGRSLQEAEADWKRFCETWRE